MPGPFPKPDACKGCSFEHTGRGFVRPDPLTPGALLVYGEAPGEDEELEGKGFVGRSGRLLRGALQRAGISSTQASFTNAVLCRPPWNEYPGPAVAAECRARHPRPELNGFTGPVVAYGANATEALSGFRLPPLEARGSVLPVAGGQGWFVYGVHPAFILRAASKARGVEQGKAMDEMYPMLALDADRSKGLTPRVPRVELPTVEQLQAAWEHDRPTIVSVDIEGKDGIPKIVGLAWRPGHVFVLEWDEALLAFLKKMFAAEWCIPLFHNANYDVPELRQAGVPRPAQWLDTINIAALEDPSLRLRLEVQVLSWVPGSITWKDLVDHDDLEKDYDGPKGAQVGTYRKLWTEVLTRLGRRVPSNGTEWYKFYNGLDTAWTLDLYHQLSVRQTADGNRFQRYYMGVMQPVQNVLMDLTDIGMPFDPSAAKLHEVACRRLERMAKGIVDTVGRGSLHDRLNAAQFEVDEMEALRKEELEGTGARAFSMAPALTKLKGNLRQAKKAFEEGFNIGSPKQRTELLYKWLGLPVQNNDAGNPTADEDALESLHRRLTKIGLDGQLDPAIKPKRGTREEAARVLKALIAGAKWTYWRTHYLEPPLRTDEAGQPWLITQYSQHRADTGRLSSGIDVTDPEKNRKTKVQQVQNIPKKLRNMVRAERGRVFVAADWTAIQWALAMWFCAKLNRPPGYHLDLLNRQQAGELDPHTHLASIAFGLTEDAVLAWQRQVCKAYTFGYLFDGSPGGLADDAGHKRSIGERVCAGHDRAYKTRHWKDHTVQMARQMRYVETPLGWRRWFWGLDPKGTEILATLIQAAEADLLKWTLTTFERGASRQFDYRLMTTTHDSIMIDAPEKDVDVAAGFLKGKLEQPVPWLDGRTWRCKVKAGETWRDVS